MLKGVTISLPLTTALVGNQPCENPILLFLLKTRLVFVSLLNYTIGEVSPFFSLLLVFFSTIFYDFFN